MSSINALPRPLQSYFKDSWNIFDFVTVVGSIVDALMVEFAVRKRLTDRLAETPHE